MPLGIELPYLSGKSPGRAEPVLGDERQQYVDMLHGPAYAAAKRGRLFVATTLQAGIALIVSATTGNHPTLWNPAGSGRNLSILKLDLTWLSGNNAPTGLEWDMTTNTGSAPAATAAVIPTFTRVAVQSALLGGPVDSVAWWAPAGCTFTAAPAFYRGVGISLFTGIGTTAVAPFSLGVEYDGELNIAPGNALSLCSRAATTTALFQVSVVFEEIDI